MVQWAPAVEDYFVLLPRLQAEEVFSASDV